MTSAYSFKYSGSPVYTLLLLMDKTSKEMELPLYFYSLGSFKYSFMSQSYIAMSSFDNNSIPKG
jgi:hypothetical protein